ncbi:unnamed protein product [Urochloa humidicola]
MGTYSKLSRNLDKPVITDKHDYRVSRFFLAEKFFPASASPRWRRCRAPAARFLAGDLAPRHSLYNRYSYLSNDDELYYGGLDGRREGISRLNHQEPPPDDKEFIQRCLAGERPRE